MSCLKMVFEAVVSSQLNKFLGDYIENLNSSQLKVGLLGGKPLLTPPPFLLLDLNLIQLQFFQYNNMMKFLIVCG